MQKATHDEVLAMCFLLFIAGMDTVTNVGSFAYRNLASDPALQDRLRADEALLRRIPRFWRQPGVRHGARIGPILALDTLPLEWTAASDTPAGRLIPEDAGG